MSSSQRRLAELEALYRRRWAAFARIAISLTGSVELGTEAVQEGFARAIEQRDRFRGECPLEAWVWRIVVNAARDARRKGRPLPGLRDRPDPPSVNGHGSRLPLELLTDRQREVLFLHYYADLGYDTIADALGISAGTVGATLSTARRVLRQALAPEVKS